MPPKFTEAQRTEALAKAGAARRQRAELKELLSTGSLTLGEVLERAESDDVVAGTKVASLLVAMPGMGKITTIRLMQEIGIDDSRRIRGLGSRQREALLQRFG